MRRANLVVAGALAVAVALGVAVGLRAQGRQFSPPTLAFLDMKKVIENYGRSKKVEDGLNEKMERLKSNLEERKRELQSKAADLDLLSKDSEPYRDGKEQLELELYKLQYHAKQSEEQLRQEARNEMVAIYREIQDAVERYSRATGIQAVLVVSRGDLPGDSLPEVRLQIAVRPVLYCEAGLDITEPILQILNAK